MSDRDRLVQELKGLRKGRGLTAVKLRSCPQLTRMLGAATSQQGVELLKRAIESLGDNVEAQALRSAYGLVENSAATLTDRRGAFSERVSRSFDTIQDYEDAAINEMVEIMAPGGVVNEAWVTDQALMNAYGRITFNSGFGSLDDDPTSLSALEDQANGVIREMWSALTMRQRSAFRASPDYDQFVRDHAIAVAYAAGIRSGLIAALADIVQVREEWAAIAAMRDQPDQAGDEEAFPTEQTPH